jgi:hypothetical protein
LEHPAQKKLRGTQRPLFQPEGALFPPFSAVLPTKKLAYYLLSLNKEKHA